VAAKWTSSFTNKNFQKYKDPEYTNSIPGKNDKIDQLLCVFTSKNVKDAYINK